jgi:hypothetical protein
VLRGDSARGYGIEIRPDGYVLVESISTSSAMQTYRCGEADLRKLVDTRAVRKHTARSTGALL